jgi:molecular chaperone GrpE
MAKKQEENKKIEELIEKVGLLEDQLKRAVADYQNLEKRVTEGRSELSKWATGDLITRILPTLDHLDTALKGAEESQEKSGWLTGVELAVKEMKRVLEEEGLTPVQVEVFDPALHEAVEVKEGEEGKILEVAQMGYNLNGKILRPAKVVVGKAMN